MQSYTIKHILQTEDAVRDFYRKRCSAKNFDNWKYIYIEPEIKIRKHCIKNNELLVLQSPNQIIDNRSTGGNYYKINDSTLEVLESIDGTRTYQEVVEYFQVKYGEQRSLVEKNL